MFPSAWFDEEGCEGGLAALGWYHEKKDDKRDIGLGPEHDWSSHGADSFGLACIVAEEAMRPGASIEDPYKAFRRVG
jgi:phage terminase large subunit